MKLKYSRKYPRLFLKQKATHVKKENEKKLTLEKGGLIMDCNAMFSNYLSKVLRFQQPPFPLASI